MYFETEGGEPWGRFITHHHQKQQASLLCPAGTHLRSGERTGGKPLTRESSSVAFCNYVRETGRFSSGDMMLPFQESEMGENPEYPYVTSWGTRIAQGALEAHSGIFFLKVCRNQLLDTPIHRWRLYGKENGQWNLGSKQHTTEE